MKDEPDLDDVETGPLDDPDGAKTTALPSVSDDQPTNPVRQSMLSQMALPDDETEFMRQSEVDTSHDPTEELRAENLRAAAFGEIAYAETMESGEGEALQRRRPAVDTGLDDSDIVTIETDEEQALQRRRRRVPPAAAPQTRPAVLLDGSMAPLAEEPPTQPHKAMPPGPQLRPPTKSRSLAFWKRESFWRSGQATQPAEVLRVPLSDDEREVRQAQALKVALAGGFVGAVIALATAMTTWMDPSVVLLLALACTIPVAGLSAWFSRPEDLGQVALEDVQLLIKPVLAGAAVLFLFTLPWQLGFVRSTLRPFTADSPAMSLQILKDRSETVATNECIRIVPNQQRVKALAAGLPGRVDVTRACFEQVTDQPQAAARDLLTEWRPSLVAPNVDAQTACGIAESAAVLPLPRWELRSAFVDCVVEGGADVQKCCGAALRGMGLSEDAEPPPPDFTPDEPAAGSWLRFTIGKVTPRQAKIRQAAGLDGRLAEDAAIDFACRAAQRGDNMGPHFVDSLKNSCGLGAQAPTDKERWVKICSSMRQRLQARQDRTKARALCDAAKAGGALLGAQPDEPAEP